MTRPRRCRALLLVAAIAGFAAAVPAQAQAQTKYPVTIDNCGREITFERAPARAVSHDLNISEIMFALDLQDRMVAVSGITGWYKMTPAFKRARGDIPEITPKNPTLESLLSVSPDFFFAGWYYGMEPGGAITPASLSAFGINTYVLSESCVHVGRRRTRATMDLLYDDILNIGRIFGRVAEARRLVARQKARVAQLRENLTDARPLRVFLYDNGEDRPFTAGRYAMPTAIIEAAGGRNILDDVETSWGRVGWESVVDRNPELVIIVGYQDGSWRDRWNFLKSFPPMAATDAVRNNRFIVLGYTEITPGPGNISAIERLAQGLHAVPVAAPSK